LLSNNKSKSGKNSRLNPAWPRKFPAISSFSFHLHFYFLYNNFSIHLFSSLAGMVLDSTASRKDKRNRALDPKRKDWQGITE